MLTRKKYRNGQKRGGTPGYPTDTSRKNPKDYHRQEIMFHGSESAFAKWAEKKAGY